MKKVLARAAEEAIDDGVDDEGADLEAHLPFEAVGTDEVETGRIGQGRDELGIRHLLARGDFGLDDRAEEAGEGRAEVSGEGLVQRLKHPHLVLGDALGAFEVVVLDLCRGGVAVFATEDLGRGRFLGDSPRRDGVEQGVDLALVEDFGHGCGRTSALASRTPTWDLLLSVVRKERHQKSVCSISKRRNTPVSDAIQQEAV